MGNDSYAPRTLSAEGFVTKWRRPSQLLMLLPLRAEASTLELQLGVLKKQIEASRAWLSGLGASSVESGEAHFPDQSVKNPMEQIRARSMMPRLPGQPEEPETKPGICATLLAIWEIQSLTAAEVLVLVDRLRFETLADQAPAEEPIDYSPLTDPIEQYQAIFSQLSKAGGAPGEQSPKIVFRFQLPPDELQAALVQALANSRQRGECLAAAAGLKLGDIHSIFSQQTKLCELSCSRMMEQRNIADLFFGTPFQLEQGELVTEDPRSVAFTVTVNVIYEVQRADDA